MSTFSQWALRHPLTSGNGAYGRTVAASSVPQQQDGDRGLNKPGERTRYLSKLLSRPSTVSQWMQRDGIPGAVRACWRSPAVTRQSMCRARCQCALPVCGSGHHKLNVFRPEAITQETEMIRYCLTLGFVLHGWQVPAAQNH